MQSHLRYMHRCRAEPKCRRTDAEILRDTAVYTVPAVTIVEIMGRNAGWLAAASALAKGDDCVGVDMIYLPERPFNLEKCAEKTKKLLEEKDFPHWCICPSFS